MPIETWATVRVEDTGDGLIIHPDDAKKWRLIADHQYSGHFLPDGRYRIALTHAPEQTAAADTGLVERLTAERDARPDIPGGWMAVTVGGGLSVYGSFEAIHRVQNYIMLDSLHPVEKEDVRRSLMRDLQAAEQREAAARADATLMADQRDEADCSLAAAREQIAALERQCDCKQIDALANSVGMKFVSWKAKAEAVEASLSSAQETISRMTEALTVARTTLNELWDCHMHNTEAGCEAWDDVGGVGTIHQIDAALTLAGETNDGQ